MNTAHVYAALRQRFCAPEWAIFFEVPNRTGGGGGYADCVAMNLYPSRGLEINGFEVKVSRSDWLRERRDPGKAETLFRFCDRWWLVVGDRSIVKDGELPVNWGLIAPRGDGLAVVTQAPKLESQPITRELFAALARRASGASSAEIEALVRARVKTERDADRQSENQQITRLNRELEELRGDVRAFEDAAGVRIRERWNRKPEEVGAAVRFYLEGGLKSVDETLATMEGNATALAARIREVRAANARETEPEPTGAPA